MSSVRGTLDGNSFIPPKAVQRGFMPIYYTVIARDRIDLYKNLFGRKYFITVQLRSFFFSRLIALEMHFLNTLFLPKEKSLVTQNTGYEKEVGSHYN